MSAVTKQEIVAMIEGIIESDACMGSISNKQAITALELVNRIKQHGIAPDMPCGTEKYPLNAYIWKRESTNEWVLEISGSINDCFFTSRHTEPLDTKAEDVASLPTLYKKIESIAPPDGYLLVHKDIMTLTVECRCGVQQAKPVHHYLKQADEETHRRVDDAVRAGRIFDKRFRGGFVSVPVEPTQEMIDAGIMFGTSPTKVSIIWSNMLADAIRR